MNRETRQLAVFALIFSLIALMGVGMNALFQNMAGVGFYDFTNYSFMEWIAQVLYWIFLVGSGVWCGSSVANDTY